MSAFVLCVCLYLCMIRVPSPWRLIGFLELELQATLSCPTCVLIEFEYSERTANTHMTETSLRPLHNHL